jgi:hypothetical protein
MLVTDIVGVLLENGRARSGQPTTLSDRSGEDAPRANDLRTGRQHAGHIALRTRP